MEDLWITQGPAELDAWIERTGTDPQEVARIVEGLRITAAGAVGEHAHDQSPEVYFPGLRSTPWWDRDAFGWLDELEAAADDIRAELETYRSEQDASVSHPTGLARPDAWRALYLTSVGKAQEQVRRHFPRTVAALRAVPGEASCGMSYFSSIEGETDIAPHSGFTNAHLRCHLSLVATEGSTIRVHDEWRSWVEGKAMVFDDSYDHEVRNRGSQRRTVLLFDFWHPDLTPVEVRALGHMMDVWRRMYQRHFWADQLTAGAFSDTQHVGAFVS